MAKAISDQQLEMNRALHLADPAFGNRATGSGVAARLPHALKRMHEYGVCSSVLDYGTGKGLLVERLRETLPREILLDGYDPAVERWSDHPKQSYDIVTCLDVLEHVEIESIDAALKDIVSLTKGFCYVVVDLQPAVKRLSDGRNAHVLLAPPEWWVSRFSQLFACITSFPIKHVSGTSQKIVIVASQDVALSPYMYSFLNKINVYSMAMRAGSLKG